jgi:hypothetical protein
MKIDLVKILNAFSDAGIPMLGTGILGLLVNEPGLVGYAVACIGCGAIFWLVSYVALQYVVRRK